MSKTIGIIIVIITIAGAGWFIFNDINKNNNASDVIIDNIVATSTGNVDDIQLDIVESTEDNILSDDVVKVIDPNAPDLDKPIVFYNNELPEETKTLLRDKITKIRSRLKGDTDIFSDWLSLGVNYKIAGGYEEARDAWEYASIIRPLNSTSFGNLGDLYHFYLKDFPKAEKNLRTAIENNKQSASSYTALHELYKYSYKQDTALVTDVLFEGLTENPNNTDLLITLAAYYKEVGNTINAKKYYEQARDEAQKLGNIQLVELLDVELSKF